jgi:hypothetical protein
LPERIGYWAEGGQWLLEKRGELPLRDNAGCGIAAAIIARLHRDGHQLRHGDNAGQEQNRRYQHFQQRKAALPVLLLCNLCEHLRHPLD